MSAGRLQKANVVLVGASMAGKSALFDRFLNENFRENYHSTIINHKILKMKELELHIWDLSADPRYENLNELFLKNVQIALICYDITSQHSFEQVQHYVNLIEDKNSNEYIPIYLVGLKADLENRVVDEDTAKRKAKELDIEFFGEVSAKENINVRALLKFLNRVGLLCGEESSLTNSNDSSFMHSTKKQKPSIFDRVWTATKSFLSRHWPELVVGGLVLILAVTLAVVFWPLILGSAAVSALTVSLVAAVQWLGLSVTASAMVTGVAASLAAVSITAATTISGLIMAGVRKLIDKCSQPKQAALNSAGEKSEKIVSTDGKVDASLGANRSTRVSRIEEPTVTREATGSNCETSAVSQTSSSDNAAAKQNTRPATASSKI